jgi:hypothetical protein
MMNTFYLFGSFARDPRIAHDIDMVAWNERGEVKLTYEERKILETIAHITNLKIDLFMQPMDEQMSSKQIYNPTTNRWEEHEVFCGRWFFDEVVPVVLIDLLCQVVQQKKED